MAEETKKDQITFDILNEIKYHELKEKFESLGVGEAWKQGEKKEALIKKALQLLGEIEAKENLKKKEKIEKIEVDEEIITNTKKEKEKEEEEKEKEEEKREYSREVLEKNLKNIQANLKNNVLTHRTTLIAKQKKVQAMLDALGEADNNK